MINVPQSHPTRRGWLFQLSPDGGFHGWPESSRPSIQPNHIDGPLAHFRNGELHWLTIWERILFAFGLVNAEAIERKYRPELQYIAGDRSVIGRNAIDM